MTSLRLSSFFILTLSIAGFGCGDDSGPGDSGLRDALPMCTLGSCDDGDPCTTDTCRPATGCEHAPACAGMDASVDSATDSGTATDAATMSCDSYGASCSGAAGCGGGLDCVGGFCLPTGTEICGGFAGATCSAGKTCLFITGTDFGGCVEPSEATCVCSSTAASRFTCST